MDFTDVSYEYDHGPMAAIIDIEDRQIEWAYNSARPDVLSNEPPPPKRIEEDLVMETQYSEGESDGEDTPTAKDFRHITRMLRQADPQYIDETSFLKVLPSETKSEYAVLSKPAFNPEVTEFKPTAEEMSPQTEKEETKATKPARRRNVAMESIVMRFRKLEAEMMSKSSSSANSSAHSSSGSMSNTIVYNEGASSQTPLDGVLASPSRSTNSTPKIKKSKDFVPSANALKYYEEIKGKMNKEVRGQRPALNLLSDFIDVKLSEH